MADKDKTRTQALKDAALGRLQSELAGNLEQQLENDALIWARTIAFDARPPAQAMLRRIFTLLFHCGVSYRATSSSEDWNHWTWPTAALLSHGCRVLIQYPATAGLEGWLGFKDTMTTRFSTHYITPITHGADGQRRSSKWKQSEDNLLAHAEYGGRKFIREVSLKQKDGTDYFTRLQKIKKAEAVKQLFNKGTNYGLNLAIGGDSDVVRATQGELWVWLDPTRRPIKADGGHGHLFIFHRSDIVRIAGTSYSGLLIGCENSAPAFFGEKGTKTTKGALTGAHGPAGTRNPVSATGGCKWSEMKDASLVKPDNFDCVFLNLHAPVVATLAGLTFSNDMLSSRPQCANIRPAPDLRNLTAVSKTLFHGGWDRALGR
jgi:Novel toxin 11